MKFDSKFKYLTTIILIISFLCSPFSLLIVEAIDGYQNNTASYNCYAYAINRVVINGVIYRPNSDFPIYQPGDISENSKNNFDSGINGYELGIIKCNVIKDLYAMGHSDISIYMYNENNYESNVDYDYYDFYDDLIRSIDFTSKELICFRVGLEDYHFMRYDNTTQSWYHKSGYDPIYKYTDNRGIPANDVAWVGSDTYDSDIIFLTYNKLLINIEESGIWEGEVTVKGGSYIEDDNYNYVYCCGNVACCNPNSICNCSTAAINGGKDVLYEITVNESGCYNISLSGGISAGFNYKIYSYDIYNGNYMILSEENHTIDVDKNLYFIASESNINRYFLIIDYGAENEFDIYINASATRGHTYAYESYSATQHLAYCECGESELQDHIIENGVCIACSAEHTHDYTDHYEQGTLIQHKAYCRCGEYKLQRHQLVDGECSLCGELHQHLFSYTWISNVTHQEVCFCGEEGRIKPHVVESDAFSGGAMYATCIVCGGRVSRSPQIILSVNKLPHTENGSYIRPDGIIVLVGEDIEAYLDGMLEFVYPDDNFETE